MREIKFRYWDAPRKRMLYQDHGDLTRCGETEFEWAPFVFVFEDQQAPPNVELKRVMQFTGLLDNNGKEIYEGDILIQFHGQPYECVYEVVWERRGAWWLKLPQKKDAHLEMGDYREGLEVAGNIYENPDLLKETP